MHWCVARDCTLEGNSLRTLLNISRGVGLSNLNPSANTLLSQCWCQRADSRDKPQNQLEGMIEVKKGKNTRPQDIGVPSPCEASLGRWPPHLKTHPNDPGKTLKKRLVGPAQTSCTGTSRRETQETCLQMT